MIRERATEKKNNSTHRKWTKIYFVLFLFIDFPSLNHVTFGAGSPSTLHTILTRLPSLTVKLGDIDSIEARLPANKKKEKEDGDQFSSSCVIDSSWMARREVNGIGK